ncbi:MAG: PaaI family thioesterase [Acidimicrobiia bacterium]|nr:PaaI family thioesterase [Acidimicrobiia bacterium]
MDRSLGDGGMPLLGRLGVAFDSYGEGWSGAGWVPTELACNPIGIVQAGVHGVVLDAAMNFAMSAALDKGEHGATLEMKISTIRPARAGDHLRVRGEVVRLARQVAYLEATVCSGDGEVVSNATGTFIVRRKDG